MVRTIEDILGLEHLNIHDQGVEPMTHVFDLSQSAWNYTAAPSAYLYGTQLPLPRPVAGLKVPKPTHSAAWWADRTKGMDFSKEDRVDPNLFNRIVWQGLKGNKPYPLARGQTQAAESASERSRDRSTGTDD
jgi:hypothetical protein